MWGSPADHEQAYNIRHGEGIPNEGDIDNDIGRSTPTEYAGDDEAFRHQQKKEHIDHDIG